jgi:hypothetical protein
MTDSSFRVGVKDAVKSAVSFVNEMYEGQDLKDLLLEEVEMEQEIDAWLVTIGFSLPQEDVSPSHAATTSRKLRRVYKVVTINAQSGVPLSMKIREL